MDSCESGDDMKKAPKSHGESSVNKRKHKKRKTKKKRKQLELVFEDGQVLYDREWDLKFGDGPVLYDGDPTRTDDKSRNILNECTDFALQVHNDTHMVKFILVGLVRATGSLSSMMDLMFTAKPKPGNGDDINPRTFRARVSFTNNYVEFVDFLPPHLTSNS